MTVKRKRMTQREKDLRARTKKELQEQGILPPDKPRLNRKKFARETWSEFQALLGRDQNCRWHGQEDRGCLRPGGWNWLPGYKGCADFEWSEAARRALKEEREKEC